MGSKQAIRFAVAVPGPDPGTVRAASATMRVWVTREDVYVGPRDGAGTFKMSFHGARAGQPEAWQLGYTREHWESRQEPLWIGSDRIIQTWQPTPFIDHVRTLLAMDFHRGGLTAPRPDPAALPVEYPSDLDGFIRVQLLVTDQPAAGCRGQIGKPLTLASGKQLWLSKEVVPDPVAAATHDVHPADAAILQPGTLEQDGLSIPHLRIHGATLDRKSFAGHRPACPWPAPPSPRQGPAPQGPFSTPT